MFPLRRHGWWLIPELCAVAALATGLIYLRPGGLPSRLDTLAQTTLERLAPAELELFDVQGHGGEAKVICAVESFATEPATVERVEDVRVIYAHYLCALAQPNTAWDYATRSEGPVVISLTNPPTVRIAQSGVGYPDRVRAMMPDALEAQAFAGFSDRRRPSALVVRYHDEVS
ncbi:hypothetical protein F4553_006982 [Allocatelliglobosispora scoriae]|uniref:Uncharacterized protein n=1 Tax=Allocatelliglobosispora scoriae TaxID=643052 RepID=A0A841C1C5_9ACTN|nr:hypothetical protein [Allocatelliglobosispora scoriae]MBB5873548.1 hypothetical protein [Allocatelliglobosispora scoriae]